MREESLERAIAYVQMNSVAANICLSPSDYPWGTGGAFFQINQKKGRPISTLSLRLQRTILRTRTPLTGDYLIDEKGMVIPSSYVNVKFVENLYRTPKRMNYFLQNSSKARLRAEAPSFNDQLIHAASRDLCVSLFRHKSINELTEGQKIEFLRQLRYRFSAEPNQLSRVTGVPYSEICRLLDTV